MAKSLEPGYFDALYAADADPWRFETSAYEDAKYRETLAALPRERYANGVEIGCSIGVLTAWLATRCDRLLGLEVAQAALDAATKRVPPNVDLALSTLPETLPPGRFDLIMLSEVLYYFDGDGDGDGVRDMAATVTRIARDDASIMLVRWLGPTPRYPLDGETAVQAFLDAMAANATVMHKQRARDYRLDVLRVRAA